MNTVAETIALWPDGGSPTVIERVPDEIAYEVQAGVAKGTTFLRNISEPTLSVFTPPADAANGRGVIVVPGGGWTINAWSHEGIDVARWLTPLGFTAFLLKYRVQASNPDQAAFEAQSAAMDADLAAITAKATKPRAIADIISTNAYLRGARGRGRGRRRAIALAREHPARFGVRPETSG